MQVEVQRVIPLHAVPAGPHLVLGVQPELRAFRVRQRLPVDLELEGVVPGELRDRDFEDDRLEPQPAVLAYVGDFPREFRDLRFRSARN